MTIQIIPATPGYAVQTPGTSGLLPVVAWAVSLDYKVLPITPNGAAPATGRVLHIPGRIEVLVGGKLVDPFTL